MEELKPENQWGRMVDTRDKISRNAVNKKDFIAIIIVMLICMIGAFVYLLLHVNSLQVQLSETKSSLQQQIALTSGQGGVQEAQPRAEGLEKAPYFFHQLDWQVIGKNTYARTATLLLSALPIEYTDTTDVIFKVYCDGQFYGVFDAVKDNEPTFEAYVDVPMVSIVDVEVILRDKITRQVEIMGTINLHDYYLLGVENEFTGTWEYKDEALGLKGKVSSQIVGNKGYFAEPNQLRNLDLILYTDGGKEWKKIPIDLSEIDWDNSRDLITLELELAEQIQLKPGKSLEVQIQAKDKLGFTYKQSLQKVTVQNDQSLKITDKGKVTIE